MASQSRGASDAQPVRANQRSPAIRDRVELERAIDPSIGLQEFTACFAGYCSNLLVYAPDKPSGFTLEPQSAWRS
jgi:hypothetical protein